VQEQKAAGQGADQAHEAAQEPSQQAQDGPWEEG
jgi:hypothetical protein